MEDLRICCLCEEYQLYCREAQELEGETVCVDCAPAYIAEWHEANGQFGVGA